MISTITNQGKVRFMTYQGTMNAQRFIIFLKRLIKGASRNLFVILDNLRVHHSKIVKKWVEENKDEIELFYLPSYSPELNPDEYLNNDLKSGIGLKKILRELLGFLCMNQLNMQQLKTRYLSAYLLV